MSYGVNRNSRTLCEDRYSFTSNFSEAFIKSKPSSLNNSFDERRELQGYGGIKEVYEGDIDADVQEFCHISYDEAKEDYDEMVKKGKFEIIFVTKELYEEVYRNILKFVNDNNLQGYRRDFEEKFRFGPNGRLETVILKFVPTIWTHPEKGSIKLENSPVPPFLCHAVLD